MHNYRENNATMQTILINSIDYEGKHIRFTHNADLEVDSGCEGVNIPKLGLHHNIFSVMTKLQTIFV